MYRAAKYILPALFGLFLIFVGFWLFSGESKQELRISAGSPGGTYHAFAEALAEVVNARSDAVSIKVLESAGSGQNSTRISTGVAELGLIQSDTVLDKNASIAAKLYPEIFHLIAHRNSGIESISDLAGKRIALQKRGSGSNVLFSRLLSHYELSESDIKPIYGSFIDGEKALSEGWVDAMFIVIAIGNKSIERLIKTLDLKLIPINQADALALFNPALRADHIPVGAYDGKAPVPKTTIKIVAVDSLLAVSNEVPDTAVREIVRTLFDSRQLLVGKIPQAAFIGQPTEQHKLSFAMHAGAERYYTRDAPPFIVEYAEPLALGMSAFVLLFSGLWQLRSWLSGARKNRADHHNLALVEFTRRIERAQTQSDLNTIRAEMFDIFEKVIVDLDNDEIEENSLQSFSFAWEVAISALNSRQMRLGNGAVEPVKQVPQRKRSKRAA